MAPDDRRAALIAATVPLLREHGITVSTRQIADAAGVAEGTIFGVFPDKATLLRAAVVRALDPQPLADFVAGLDGDDLRTRLRTVVDRLRKGMADNIPLMAAIRALGGSDPVEGEEFMRRLGECRGRLTAAVATVFEPDRAALRRDPEDSARLLVMLVSSTVHHFFGGARRGFDDMDSDEIVSLLLDGLLVRPTGEHP
jgi:AcrR family transcriptional regulator